MAVYKANENADTWNNSSLAAPKGTIIKAGTIITADNIGDGILQVNSKLFTRTRWFDLIADNTPPPPPPVVVEPPKVAGMYVVRGDEELTKFDFQSRTLAADWGYLKQTPAVHRFERTARLPQSDYRVDISPLDAAIRNLNGNHKNKMARLYSSGTALFNRTGYPKQQYLVMSKNILKPMAIEGNYLKFETLKSSSNVAGMTCQTHPHFVMRWVLVTTDAEGRTVYTIDRYGEIYWYLTTNEGYGYIPLEWVKLV